MSTCRTVQIALCGLLASTGVVSCLGNQGSVCEQAAAHVRQCLGDWIGPIDPNASAEECAGALATPCPPNVADMSDAERQMMYGSGALCDWYGICVDQPRHESCGYWGSVALKCYAVAECPGGRRNHEDWHDGDCPSGKKCCDVWGVDDSQAIAEERKKKERCTTAAGDEQACPVETSGNSSGGTDSRGYCGDKSCRAEEKEDCTSCVADCGYCLACGDGSCNYHPEPGETIENCSNCPQDCGQCAVCGDGSCWENREGTDGETCASCPQDCCPSESNNSSSLPF